MRLSNLAIATLNLLNLNLPGLPLYGNRTGWSEEEYQRKVAWTGFMMRRVPADLFAFQELWHPDALAAVLAEAKLDTTHALVAPPGHSGRKIVCAAAVRRDLLSAEPAWITDFPPGVRFQSRGDDPQTPAISVSVDSFSRPVLHLRIRPRSDRPEIHVFVCHFKSKGPTQVASQAWFKRDEARYGPHATALGDALSTIRRTAEAAALRVILNGVMKDTDTPVIVLGDLNDDHNSNTLNIITEQPQFLRPMAQGGRDTALYSGQALQEFMSQRDVYYTYIHEGMHGSLDHILVSEQFYPNSRKRVWNFEGLDIYNDHLNSEAHKFDDGAGDHGMVRARFKFAPAR